MKSIKRNLVPVVIAGLLALPGAAWGATRHTQVTGADSGTCGAAASPCRTITQAMANASAGDTIAVGPGQYGSANGDADLSDAGEESSGVAGKMIVVNKELALVAASGTGSVVLSGSGVTGITALVSIESDGVTFGKKGKGFVVSNLVSATGAGVAVSPAVSDVTVEGNTFRSITLNSLVLDGIGNSAKENSLEKKVAVRGADHVLQKNTLRNCVSDVSVDGSGHTVAKNRLIQGGSIILAATSSSVLVKQNEISGDCGGSAVTVLGGANHVFSANTITGRDGVQFDVQGGSKNQFLNNVTRGGSSGFLVTGGSDLTFIGNLASGHTSTGFFITPFPVTNITMKKNVSIGNGGMGFSFNQTLTLTLVGNSAIGNGDAGIFVAGAAVLDGNNVFGNGTKALTTYPNCGLVQAGIALADASNNFWGDAAGPGANPADDICNNTTFIDATYPAAVAFKVKPAKAIPY